MLKEIQWSAVARSNSEAAGTAAASDLGGLVSIVAQKAVVASMAAATNKLSLRMQAS